MAFLRAHLLYLGASLDHAPDGLDYQICVFVYVTLDHSVSAPKDPTRKLDH